ncbi:RimJ/RimL family protein N-acetyltransferase [Pseudoduganella lurida]|uniref:RimJ/RimL family protein N-acetyltransferase n=1 Tax=Pseudoduganella lurida TaxID=1036180 RepID=A0A562R5V2_9BURK|nr:GNAT family N-acetyltransferase [Pseudoduganella lurida]TWI64437.1 RimJ/RimL family protein N-acetyltransferase [Pseudoduganella lurida]
MKILETERLLLRTLATSDAAFFLALVNEPSWLANIGDKNIRTLEAASAHILSGPMQMQRRLGHSLYLVERKGDGMPLGLCGLIRREALPDTDIGYALAPRHWGQGYAFEAAAGVVRHARSVLGLRRLFGITDPGNAASIALLHKLGMQFVRRTHLPPAGRDTNVYCLEFGPAEACRTPPHDPTR